MLIPFEVSVYHIKQTYLLHLF